MPRACAVGGPWKKEFASSLAVSSSRSLVQTVWPSESHFGLTLPNSWRV